jgi:hypothetical protein
MIVCFVHAEAAMYGHQSGAYIKHSDIGPVLERWNYEKLH